MIKNIGDLLTKHGLSGTDVKTAHEVVCNVKAKNIDHNVTLAVKAELPTSKKQAADDFNKDVKSLTEGISGVSINLACTVGAGMKYAAIENITNIENDEALTLEHKQGEVWLVDFWATWCPPCQKPMAHNQEMLDKKGEEWKDKVRIIGISIDQKRESVSAHVASKKWTSVEHYIRAGSNCSTVYGVRGVPNVMIIDQDGTIVFKGHPATRPNLEEDLDKLSRGEKLEGAGIVELIVEAEEGEVAAQEPKVKEGYSEIDLTEVEKEIVKFKEVATGFQNNEELSTAATAMARSFCVIVLESLYNPVTGKTHSSYKNYRVLVGKQENIDKINEAFERDVKGSFEIEK